MSPRSIKLLIVEDNPIDQRVITHHLKAIDTFAFDITCVDTEDAAVDTFRRGGIQFVLLDYMLLQGDGVTCLRRLRQLDSVVPIIAVSRSATSDVSAELLRFGADDYLDKQSLTSGVLAKSVRQAIGRADAWREREGGM